MGIMSRTQASCQTDLVLILLYCLRAVQLRASHFLSLNLSVPVCKMGAVIASTSGLLSSLNTVM